MRMAFIKLLRKTKDEPSRLAKAVRHLQVTLDDPHATYRPRDVLFGQVLLDLKQNVANVRVRLTFIGEVKSKYGTAHKRGGCFMEKSTVLYGDDGGLDTDEMEPTVNGLTKGVHKFPFSIRVPSGKKIHSSIKFERGSVSYHLMAVFESVVEPEGVSAKVRTKVNILVPIDVYRYSDAVVKTILLNSNAKSKSHKINSNDHNGHLNGDVTTLTTSDGSSEGTKKTISESQIINNLSQRQVLQKSKSEGSKSESIQASTGQINQLPETSSQVSYNAVLTNGMNRDADNQTVKIDVRLPHSGFVQGEYIPLTINVSHYREYYHPAGVIATLVRVCKVASGRKEDTKEIYRKDICQSISPLLIESNKLENTISTYLKVPNDIIASMTSLPEHFTFQYFVEVVINLSRKLEIYSHSQKPLSYILEKQKTKKPLTIPRDLKELNLPASVNENGAWEVPRPSLNNEKSNGGIDSSRNDFQSKFGSAFNKSTLFGLKNIDEIHVAEQTIIFDDMVDVERLKRMRNVAGLSIETIIGNKRSSPAIDLAKLEISKLSQGKVMKSNGTSKNTSSSGSIESNSIVRYRYISFEQDTQSSTDSYDEDITKMGNQLNEWLSPANAYEEYYPVPEYSANENVFASEDKQELEYKRLHELESDPPQF